jgi:hypothetical protein
MPSLNFYVEVFILKRICGLFLVILCLLLALFFSNQRYHVKMQELYERAILSADSALQSYFTSSNQTIVAYELGDPARIQANRLALERHREIFLSRLYTCLYFDDGATLQERYPYAIDYLETTFLYSDDVDFEKIEEINLTLAQCMKDSFEHTLETLQTYITQQDAPIANGMI